jgi:hypothetical protein
MNTSEMLMTDPTTEEGRRYWAERRKREEMAETEISRAHILRLYRIHDRIATEISYLKDELMFGGDPDKLTASLNRMDKLAGEIENVFAEVLTDEERELPAEEVAEYILSIIGKGSR